MPLYTVMASMSLRDYEQLHKHREEESREWRVTPHVVSDASVLDHIPATEAEINVCFTVRERQMIACRSTCRSRRSGRCRRFWRSGRRTRCDV